MSHTILSSSVLSYEQTERQLQALASPMQVYGDASLDAPNRPQIHCLNLPLDARSVPTLTQKWPVDVTVKELESEGRGGGSKICLCTSAIGGFRK